MREALRKQPLLVSEAELLVSLRASLVELAGNAPIRGELANVQRLAHSGVLARHRAAAAVPAVL